MADTAHQADQILHGKGFIAALDQSGGSSPKALKLYGIGESAWQSEDEMFDHIHAMRSRIVRSPAFTGARLIGAILFENTLGRDIDGLPSAQYLWQKRRIVPFLKVDKGLEAEADGVCLMKPMDDLDSLLERAVAAGVFGTKMRSVINRASAPGIRAIVAQQFDAARRILARGLVPIIEPEVTISIPDKAAAEDMLLAELVRGLDALPTDGRVMLKLTLPERVNLYKPLVDDPRVMRVVALSGGYSREKANALLARNAGVVASFSRALTEGLSVGQSEAAFDRTLEATIDSIYMASVAGGG